MLEIRNPTEWNPEDQLALIVKHERSVDAN